MQILNSTKPHYIRCIKPNADCKALTFKKEEVILQKPFFFFKQYISKELFRLCNFQDKCPFRIIDGASEMAPVSSAACSDSTYLLLCEKFSYQSARRSFRILPLQSARLIRVIWLLAAQVTQISSQRILTIKVCLLLLVSGLGGLPS